jgi:hypothetical protein
MDCVRVLERSVTAMRYNTVTHLLDRWHDAQENVRRGANIETNGTVRQPRDQSRVVVAQHLATRR